MYTTIWEFIDELDELAVEVTIEFNGEGEGLSEDWEKSAYTDDENKAIERHIGTHYSRIKKEAITKYYKDND